MTADDGVYRKFDSINTTLAELRGDVTELKINEARSQANIIQLQENIRLQIDLAVVEIKQSLLQVINDGKESKALIKEVGERVNQNSDRIGALERDNAVTKVKVGLWGGLAGAIALAWQIITQVWK